MANESGLRELLVEEIRDLYSAERQLTKALPKLARAANSDELRQAIEHHLRETEGQIERLETVFESLGEKPRSKHCEGIAGIIGEGSELIGEDYEGAVMDAGIIAAAQRAEHYEIGAYGSVMAWAKALGLSDIASTLEETLEEEKAADEKLSQLAEGSINQQASAMDGEVEEGEEEEMAAAGSSSRSQSGSRGRTKGRSQSSGQSQTNGRGRSSARRK
jgi:ferritin-like metal-binding protein YciE